MFRESLLTWDRRRTKNSNNNNRMWRDIISIFIYNQKLSLVNSHCSSVGKLYSSTFIQRSVLLVDLVPFFIFLWCSNRIERLWTTQEKKNKARKTLNSTCVERQKTFLLIKDMGKVNSAIISRKKMKTMKRESTLNKMKSQCVCFDFCISFHLSN